jgi:hypothetical protein
MRQSMDGLLNGASPALDRSLSETMAAFDIEDDGSIDWQRLIDLLAMLQPVAAGADARTTASIAVRTYLEGTFHAIERDASDAAGRPISELEAESIVRGSTAWLGALALVNPIEP